jgi:hypothetical protein
VQKTNRVLYSDIGYIEFVKLQVMTKTDKGIEPVIVKKWTLDETDEYLDTLVAKDVSHVNVIVFTGTRFYFIEPIEITQE